MNIIEICKLFLPIIVLLLIKESYGAVNIALGKFLYQGSNFYQTFNSSLNNSILTNLTNTKVSWSFEIPCPRTKGNFPNNWFVLDLEKSYFISYVVILSDDSLINHLVVGLTDVFSFPKYIPVREKYDICNFYNKSDGSRNNSIKVSCTYQYSPKRFIIIEKKQGYTDTIILCGIEVYEQNNLRNIKCSKNLTDINCNEVCHCENAFSSDINMCTNCSKCQAGWIGDKCSLLNDTESLQVIGCIPESDLQLTVELTRQTNLLDCINKCREANYIFAAFTSEYKCFCATQYNVSTVSTLNNFSTCNKADLSVSLYSVCPMNYFGNKCSFKCHCTGNDICSYPDGLCPNKCQQNWIGDGCHFKDKCINAKCEVNTEICVSNIDGFHCECKQGFKANKDGICQVECDEKLCDHQTQICLNISGNSSCICIPGYTLNNLTNECQVIGNCSLLKCNNETEICAFNNDSYQCICKEGFYKSINSSTCEVNANCLASPCNNETEKCANNSGVYTCICKDGYFKDENMTCKINQNCSLYNCNNETEVCIKINNSYQCVCKEGFYKAINISNCENYNCSKHSCDKINEICHKINGSYECVCKEGYMKNNLTHLCEINVNCSLYKCNNKTEVCVKNYDSYKCVCKEGFYKAFNTSVCEEFNCSKHLCDKINETCLKINGSYECVCKEGYMKNNLTNLCEIVYCDLPNPCTNKTEMCNNGLKVHNCKCIDGYKYNDNKSQCEDINECGKVHDYPCNQVNQMCTNKIGSFECTCIPGYQTKFDNNTDHNRITCEYIESEYMWWLPMVLTFAAAIFVLIITLLIFLLKFCKCGSLLSSCKCCKFQTKKTKLKVQTIELKRIQKAEYYQIYSVNPFKDKEIKIKNQVDKEIRGFEMASLLGKYQRIYVNDMEMYIERKIIIHEFKNLIKTKLSIKHAKSKKCKKLNRSKHSLPYDFNRVKLMVTDETISKDYINASKIKFVDTENLILTQAPIKKSYETFWRMIEQNNVFSIVNLCDDVQIKRDPSLKYYSHYGDITFGNCNVEFISEVKYLDYVCRKLTIRNNNVLSKVHKWHFSQWPDNKYTDLNIASILSMRQKVREEMQEERPILVHCDIGLGRSSCWIVVNELLRRHENGETVVVKDCVESLYKQRKNVIETQNQYDFIYEALAVYTELGPTVFTIDNYKKYINNPDYSNDWRIINQFQYIMKEKFKENIYGEHLDRKLAIPIKSIFSDHLILISSNVSNHIWTEIRNTVGEIIIINIDDCPFLPTFESKLELTNTRVFLELHKRTPYGENLMLKIQPHFVSTNIMESSGYVMKYVNVHRLSYRPNTPSFDLFIPLFNIVFTKAYNTNFILLLCENPSVHTFFICASYILDALRHRREVLIFPIVQELKRNFNNFSLNSSGYAELFNFVTEYLQREKEIAENIKITK